MMVNAKHIRLASLKFILVLAYCVLVSAKVWAVACDVIFSNGIQATSATGTINLTYHSILTGGSATLKTKNLTDNSSWVACSGSSCVATGTAAATSSVTFSTGSGSNGAISVAANSTLSKASGDYSTVNVGQQATLTFSTANGTYKTTGFTTNYQSIVQLQSGDYWINGNLTIGQETILRRIASSGTTRIFVNGNITMAYKVITQSFASDQLLIYATGTITADNEANLSAFIYAAGNVSFNYKSVINGAVSGANFSSPGNEVTVNYQPSAFTTANFSPFCSGTTSVPVLLGSWHMDETSWNGTAAEVRDSSGNNNHGKASVAVAGNTLPSTTSGTTAYTAGSQSTCRYGAFDGTGSPTRVYDYVELSGFPTLPNGFTFAAWIRSSNASAQHQRILVRDDAQNGWGLSLADGTGSPKLRFFARNITNNGAVTGQGTDPSCGVFCVDTNAVISSNTWYYVASVIDTSAKTVTLYVYSASGVLQAKASGAYSGTWTDGTGTAAIGGETSASGEGTQTSWHFLGNIDEVNIYSGALSQTSIESLLTTVRTCPAPDHYELDVAATSITCQGANVTVRACADSVSPCTNIDYTINSNVTLAASAGALNTTTLALASGTGTAKLLYPAAPDGTNATVTLSGEATAATNARKCCSGGNCSVTSTCSTTFKTAGFIFSTTASGAINTIPTQVAGRDGAAYLRSLQTNTTTGACVARFTSPQTIKMAYKCINPTTCVAGQTLKLNTTNIQSNASAASPIVYGNINLNFDVNGSAPIPINYTDVGQLQLFAELALGASATEPAYTLTGSTTFVVKPYTLATILPVSNPGGTTVAGADFIAAGTDFTVKVEARNALGGLTPNFGKEITNPETVQLNNLSLVYPAGGAPTALTLGEAFGTTTPVGTFVNNKVSWDQVGSFTVQARLGDGNYLGAGDLDTITTSPTIGRFYPDRFRLVTPILNNSCGSFTYMGQPMNLGYTLQAESALGTVVSNYGGNYSTTLPAYVAENADDGSALSSRFSAPVTPTPPAWTSGKYVVSTANAVFSRGTPLLAPDGPFGSVKIGVKMVDNFDSRNVQSLDMNAATANACGAGCDAKQIGSTLDMRYGRLRLDDAFGPETVALPVNFYTEFWTGNHFTLNVNDFCTLVPRAAVSYKWGVNYASGGPLTNATNMTVPLSTGSTQGIYSNIDPSTTGDIHFSTGNAGQQFARPSSAGTGEFIVAIDLTNLSWLQFDWDQGKTVGPDAKLPNATFTFGSYRGNDRVIYWREKLQ